MLNQLSKTRKRVSNLGLTENHSDKEIVKRLLRILAFTTATTACIILVIAILNEAHIAYILFCLVLPFLYFFVLILKGIKKKEWGSFYGTTILPIWVNLAILLGGGGFSESAAMASFLIFTCVLYNESSSLKCKLIGFNVLCHIAALSYITFYPPLLGVINYPHDEVVVFILSLAWMAVLFKKNQLEKNELIQKLQHKNKALSETTEELERFTYIASHDLKSPLRTIISFSDMMERYLKKGDYDKVKDNLNFVSSSAKQMNYLITDILEFSQLTNKNEIKKKELDLNLVLKKVQVNLYHEVQEKGAKIMIQELPSFYGNETEFILLFQNMIQNGIKYNTSKTPKIQIWAEQTEDKLLLNIKDNGIGIDSDHHEKIFHFFKRLHTADKYQGTGLGLGLCQKLVRKYEGNISVASVPGKGSTFTIKLPNVATQASDLSIQQTMDLIEV